MKKALALLLALLMMCSLLAGCGNNGDENPSTEPTSSDTVSTEPSELPSYEAPDEGSDTDIYEVQLPLTEDTVSFDYWVPNGSTFDGFSTYADNLFYQWMEEQTGVHLNFNHPAVGGESEAFQTMVLSQDYPDFVWGVFSYYTGGVDKAINDQFLLRLNEYVDDYMPNYKKVIYRDEDTFIRAISDSGNLWGVHHVVDYTQGAWLGLGIRQDWLERAGMTLDDVSTVAGLEQALTAFTEYTYDNQGPLYIPNGGISTGGGLSGSWNITSMTYGSTKILNVDGTATYSALMPGFKDYVSTMADWYGKGLVNRNFIADASSRASEDRWVNSDIGVGEFVYTMAGTFHNIAAVNDLYAQPDFNLVAMATPRLDESMDISKDVHIRQTHDLIRTNYSMGITTGCEDIELACRYWDYVYTPEVTVIANWGPVKGEEGDLNATYFVDPTDANGDGHLESYQPWMMEKYGNVTNIQYKVASYMQPSLCIWSREWCTLSEDEINFTRTWDQAGCDWWWPLGVTLTAEEGNNTSSILTNCNGAVTEWIAAVITGTKSVDTYETELVPQLENFGIDTAVEAYQNALDRYAQRISFINE